jgi:hypothetical protein
MGAAASIKQLPEELSEEALKDVFQSSYDPVVYHALKNGSGIVLKSDLMGAINRGMPRELFLLFTQYAPTGEISCDTFLQMVTDSKILNKQFTRASVTKIFYDVSSGSSCRYIIFKNDILPLIAEQRELELPSLLGKFASTEWPAKVFPSHITSVAEDAESEDVQHPPEKVEAAKKLQRVQRGKIARHRAKKLKEVLLHSYNVYIIRSKLFFMLRLKALRKPEAKARR